MPIHLLFDIAAWCTGLLAGWWLRRRHRGRFPTISFSQRPGYWMALLAGLGLGAATVAAFNNGLAGLLPVGHSLAGALAGGILAVELYKWRQGLRGSTGAGLALPLALGIAVGRLGCFYAGLPDFTYGIPTALPWGHDFGDGIARHPVQLYESLAMLGFAAVFLVALMRGARLAGGFYLFVAWYGAQRFAWEFLKPYPLVLGPFNLYHLLCLALILYGLGMLRLTRRQAGAQAQALSLPG